MNKIKVLLSGCNRKMGELVSKQISSTPDIRIECGHDPLYSEASQFPVFENIWNIENFDTDVIIFVSSQSNILNVLEYACKGKGIPVVIGSTGFLDTDIEVIKKLGNDIPIFMISHTGNIPNKSLASLILEATKFIHQKPAGFYTMQSFQ